MKVIKNRTAYFNQSMMEVSVLDLVLSTPKQLPVFPLAGWTDACHSSTRSSIRTMITTCCG